MKDRLHLLTRIGTIFLMLMLFTALTVSQAGATNDVVLSVELNEWTSCPFVFTWDGAEYQLENDIYSVGRGADREYTDYLFLKNAVVPKDGVYSFEIREVPSEQSFTDTFKLITIDHPANVNVGVDSSGNVHSYGNSLSLDSAYDGNGNNVLSLISVRDNEGIEIYHNDVVILDFSSVDITEGAKLVIDVDGFEGELSATPTGEVPAIRIQTLQAGTWITRHSFFPKELRAEGVFDLQPYLNESKTVRLLGVSCDEGKYHLINYVGLDNTPDDMSYSVIEPVTAVLNGNTDVLSDISGSDDVYAYTIEDDTIVVTFPFIPLTNEKRSFVIVSEGYYTTNPTGGNTYYVDTWNGSSWVLSAYLTSGWNTFPNDTIRTANLGSYLPDADGEYKVRIRNRMWWSAYYAKVDWVSMKINGVDYSPTYAKEYDTTDILSKVITSDNIRWDAMNKWAIIKFNRPPVADPNGPYLGAVNSLIDFNGTSSSDPDNDLLTYEWDFGDSNTGTGATPNHTYTEPSIYDVCLTVNDGTVDSEQVCTSAVVYDPNAGFVTGGGWIDSSEGAYKGLDGDGIEEPSSLTGKANFGFVSKYKKGDTEPSGQTEFQFQMADLNFHSDSYEWLVVTGSNYARFKGEGTINGANDWNDNPYKFMIWAGDYDPDTFRIRIWSEDEATGIETDVYDNGFEQEISGGAIVIHTKK